MYSLPVTNNGVTILEMCAGMDLVNHVGHVDRVTGIRIDTLRRVVAENT